MLSAIDPVRLFQQFATLDLAVAGPRRNGGRTRLVHRCVSAVRPSTSRTMTRCSKRTSTSCSTIRENEHVHWSGRHRPALTGQGVYPRPVQNPLPIWVGVGGTPQSFARAGALGLPLMVAIIGGETRRFRPLIDLYRRPAASWALARISSRSACTRSATSRRRKSRRRTISIPVFAKAIDSVAKERGWGRSHARASTPSLGRKARC